MSESHTVSNEKGYVWTGSCILRDTETNAQIGRTWTETATAPDLTTATAKLRERAKTNAPSRLPHTIIQVYSVRRVR